jgi:hypothetical protein
VTAASWSTIDGGVAPTGNTTVPTAADDVVFNVDATVSTASGVCLSMTVNSTVTMSGAGATTASGDVNIYGVLDQTSASGALIMIGGSTSRIYQAGGTLHKLTITKTAGQTFRVDTALNVNLLATSTITFTGGIFDFNGQTVTCCVFQSPSGTRSWNQSGDLYITGTSTTVFNMIQTSLTVTDRTGWVRVVGSGAATVNISATAAVTQALQLSCENGYNYTVNGSFYNFNLNGIALSGTVTVYNDFTGAGNNCPALNLIYSNSSAGQTREFYWPGTLLSVSFTPGTGTGNIYNINYLRATTITASTTLQTYNFIDVSVTGSITCAGLDSIYDFTSVYLTTGTLTCSGGRAIYYFGTIRITPGIGFIVLSGSQAIYNIFSGGSPGDINISGDITLSWGTINFGDYGNTTIYCRSFAITNTTNPRAINWNTSFDSFIQTSSSGTVTVGLTQTGLTTNSDSIVYNNGGFVLANTGTTTSSFSAPTTSATAFNVYVAANCIISGTVRRLLFRTGAAMTSASTVSVLIDVIAIDIPGTLTGLTLNMVATGANTYDFNYRVATVNFTTANSQWALDNVNAQTGNCTGGNSTYIHSNTNIVGTLTYGGSGSNHQLNYVRAASATYSGTSFSICTYADFQVTTTHTIGGTDTTHTLTYVRGTTGSYTGTGTFNYDNVVFTSLLTASGAGSTHNLTLVTAVSITLSGTSANYNLTNCSASTAITLSGNSAYYNVYYVRGTCYILLTATNGWYYFYDVVITNTTNGVNQSAGNLVLYQDLNAAAFICNGSLSRSINFGNYNIITSGTGSWNLSSTTGLTTYTTGGGAIITGSGAVSLGTLDQNNAINITLLSVAAFTTGTMRNFVNSLGDTNNAYYPTGAVTLTIYGNVRLSNNPGYALGQTNFSSQFSAIPFIMGRSDGVTQTLQTATDTPWGPALLTIGSLTINGSNTIQLTYPTGATTFVHTYGTLDLTNYSLNVTTSYTVTNNANAKYISFGVNDIIINATTGTPWNATDSNYLTCSGTGRVTIRGGTVVNGSTSRKYADQPNFYLQENATAYTLTSPLTTRNLTINNYTPTASFIFYIGGNLVWTFSATGIPSTVSFNFNSTPASTMSFSSTSFAAPTITINDKILSAASDILFNTMTVNSVFNSSGYTMTCGTVVTVNSGGAITCGASTWNMIGGGASTGWNMISGATINAGTSNIVFKGSGEKYASFGSSQTVNTITNSAPTPYSGWGGSFTGAGYVTAPNSATLDLGTGDFTMEAWVYATTATGIRRIAAKQNGGTNWILRLNATTNTVGFEINGVAVITSVTGLSLNTWHHVAIVYSRATPINGMNVFINGSYDTSATYAGTPGAINAITSIGAYAAISTEQFVGYISNYRFVKGTAVYTLFSTFTVPTEPLSRIQSARTNIAQLTGAETVLLTLQSPTLIDNSTTGAFALSTSGTTFTIIQNGPLVVAGGNLNISSNTQITNLTNTYNPASFIFTNTPVVTNLNITGISGSLVSITGNLNSTSSYMKEIPYVSVLNSVTTGGAGWYTGVTGVDNGGNSGWHFIKSSVVTGFIFF